MLPHCHGHAPNLAVGNTMKQSTVHQDALDLAYEVSELIRYSKQSNLQEMMGLVLVFKYSVIHAGLC